MATHLPLNISRELATSLSNIKKRVVRDETAKRSLGSLLQSALKLEFATIPAYLSAAFSLTSNAEIQALIFRIAREEMLHMTAVANVMNAIGIAPDIVAAVPEFPYDLTVLDPPLRLDLCSFSFELVEDLFMRIEAPEEPIVFDMAAEPPRTIGQFYAGIIEIIANDTIPGLFQNSLRDAYKQVAVTPNFGRLAYLNNQDTNTYPLKTEIDFKVTDKASAILHLGWVVDQGEGETPIDPLTAEGIPGHYYRFESILKSKFLVQDANAPKGFSFSGGNLPFDPEGVHVFDVNAKASDYAAQPDVALRMKRFNQDYTGMINLLQEAFNCPGPEQQDKARGAYNDAIGVMQRMPNTATAIIRKAQANGLRGGIPFEYGERDSVMA